MYRFKIIPFLLMFFIISFALSLTAQENAQRKKERMDVVKKMRLIEILDLNESEADKFISRYTLAEKLIFEKNEQFQKANESLIEYLEKNPKGKELSEKTNAVINSQKELHSAIESKISGMKQILNEQNYAKFVAFEIQFARRMKKHLMEFNNPDGMPGDEETPFQRGRRKGSR